MTTAQAFDALLAGRDLSALNPGELVAAGKAIGDLRRRVDAAFAEVSAEIARQSRPDLGRDGLARKQGFRTPEVMISTVTGVPVGEAKRLVHVGEATKPRVSISGERKPDKYPHIAEAVRAGKISMVVASAIITMLDRVHPRADKILLAQIEEQLADKAVGLRPDEVNRLVTEAEALLDPHGVELTQAEIHEDRSLVISERDGRLRVEFVTDVVSGAPVKVAVESIVTGALQRKQHRDELPPEQRGPEDTRSVRQMRADALIELATHGLGCGSMPSKPTATVVVRMTLEQLTTGTGMATIDGIAQPVPADAARKIAAELQVIPMVLGGESEILDLGRERRLFTKAQRLALTERDRGCVDCGAPPEQCIAHHLIWWSRGGTTDLRNGVLLCVSCHVRLHADGWDIQVDGNGVDANVWLIPPASIDPERRPRLAGRHKYHLAA